MNKNTKIILLSIISVLIIITIVLGITYSFMRPINETSSITSVNLESCANITLTDTGESINLSNSYPMTKNRALQTTPYTFTVSSTCPDSSGFNLYLATLNTNTLDASNIHYIITTSGTTNILAEGILSEATNGLSDFEDYEIDQLNNGINGTYGSIYKIFNGPLSNTDTSYDLYLYIDETVTNETMGQTFSAGVAVKAGEYTPPTSLAEVCNNGDNLASCITSFYDVSGSDITNIYYHTSSLANGAGDNSYRYSGANPNNYVCFGSTESPCPEENLYRIIGVFDNEVKLIKSDYTTSSQTGTDGDYVWTYPYDLSSYIGNLDSSSISSYYWNGSANNTWSESPLNTVNLNTNFLNNIGSTWSNLIATHSWKVGGGNVANLSQSNAQTAYNYEVGSNSSSTTYSAKVGLMYISDYGFAASNNYWTTNLNSYNNARNDNWMYMGLYEWTISRSSGTLAYAFFIHWEGRIGSEGVGSGSGISYAVRPCFYLNSNVQYASGIGTQSDPIRLSGFPDKSE